MILADSSEEKRLISTSDLALTFLLDVPILRSLRPRRKTKQTRNENQNKIRLCAKAFSAPSISTEATSLRSKVLDPALILMESRLSSFQHFPAMQWALLSALHDTAEKVSIAVGLEVVDMRRVTCA